MERDHVESDQKSMLFGHADECSYPGWITMGDETKFSAVVPARANGGSETRFTTENQPEGRGRQVAAARVDSLAAIRHQHVNF
jgi:hypothetical protein